MHWDDYLFVFPGEVDCRNATAVGIVLDPKSSAMTSILEEIESSTSYSRICKMIKSSYIVIMLKIIDYFLLLRKPYSK